MTARLPVFPLGTVLVPTAVLPLQIFEPRYLALMQDMTGAELGTPLIDPEFGVVLIERGSEVGGGEQRGRIGTRARLLQAQRLPDGRWFVTAAGTRRFEVDEWLPDDPYPLAVVHDRPDDRRDVPAEALDEAHGRVRELLDLADRLGVMRGPVAFELAPDPEVAAWQLCAVAPLGSMDRQRLLEAPDPASRLELLATLASEAAEMLAFRLGEG
jgi:Lon protease-like protein